MPERCPLVYGNPQTGRHRVLYGNLNLPACHGRSQGRGSVLSRHSAQAVHTPEVCCTAASPVLPAVQGYCRISPQWQGSRWQAQRHLQILPLPGWYPC